MENNVVLLSAEEREALEKFTKTGVHSAMLIRRARVILALDRTGKTEHLRINKICEETGISWEALNTIRKDFLGAESTAAFLTRKKRKIPPVAPKVTGEVEAHIIALACSEPPIGYARWTLKLLAEKSVEQHFVDSISGTHVGRILKKRGYSLT